jgi:autotransporter-associated beta strand protein
MLVVMLDVLTNCELTLNITTNITGSGGFTKFGPGSLTLSGPGNVSSYAGDTIVNEGILYLNSFNVIRHGTLKIGDGVGGAQADVVRYLIGSCIYGGPGGSTVVITNSGLLDLNGNFDDVGPIVMDGATITTGAGTLSLFPPLTTLSSANGSSTINGKLSLSTAAINTFVVTNSLIINAAVSDPFSDSLVKTGQGSMYLTFSNTYTGPTIIQQGFLWAENSLALGTTNSGTVVSNGASLVLDGSIGITNESLTLNGPGLNAGWGSLDVEHGVNTWAGPITINANSTLDSWSPGAELHINGPISGVGGLELFNDGAGGGTHFFEGSAANTYAGLTTVDAGTTLTLNKPAVSNQTIPGNLVINGTLRLVATEQINDIADVLINPGGLFDTTVNWERIDTLHGSGAMTFGLNGWIEVGLNNGSSTFDGVMSGIGYTAGGYTVAKRGVGTFTMNGNNTFTAGASHVFAGKLIVNGAQPQNPVIVDSGATLGGSGTVGTIAANGIIAPGNSPGILGSSNVTFSASGKFAVELTGPTAGSGYDQLNVTGTNILANAILNPSLAFTSPVALGQKFTIINNDGTDPISGIFTGYPEGATFQQSGYAVSISYVGGTGNDVVLTLTSIPGAAVSSTVTAGDGSHGIDPNGCNNFSLVVTNQIGAVMNGVNATLSTTTPGVLITQPYATYPNIPGHGLGTNIAPFQISTLPSFVCGTAINLQLIVNSSLGSFITSYVLNSGESAAPTRFDNNTITNVPDIGTIESTNNVASWSGGAITKVTVSLWLVAPIDSDMSLSLIAPDGTTVPLSVANGAGANFGTGSADASRTTFDDSAAS